MSGIRFRIDYLINKFSLIFGLVQVALCVTARILSKSPYEALYLLNASDILPPIWIFNILSMIWFFVSGLAFGIIIYRIVMRRNVLSEVVEGYNGGLYYVALVLLSLIWYPLFFSCRIAIALAISLICAICAVFCGVIWQRIDRYAALIILSYSVWLTYILIVNAAIFIRI